MSISSGIIHVRFLKWFSYTHNSYIIMSTLLDYSGFLQTYHSILGHQISQTKATFEHFFCALWFGNLPFISPQFNFFIHSTVLYFITEKDYFVIITEAHNPYAPDYDQKINIMAKSIYRSGRPFIIAPHSYSLNASLVNIFSG